MIKVILDDYKTLKNIVTCKTDKTTEQFFKRTEVHKKV